MMGSISGGEQLDNEKAGDKKERERDFQSGYRVNPQLPPRMQFKGLVLLNLSRTRTWRCNVTAC